MAGLLHPQHWHIHRAGTLRLGATAGSVVFLDANGSPIEDNANLFWDDTNNRLGIGTASPGARLSVRALTLTGTVLVVDQGDNSSPQTPTGDAALVTSWISSGGSSYVAAKGTANAYAGTGGYLIGAAGEAATPSGSTWAPGGSAGALIGVSGKGNSTLGGTVIGGNFTANTLTTAAGDAVGVEIDIDTRIATTNRIGLLIVGTALGTVAGTTRDEMIRLTNKVGAAAWNKAISLDDGTEFPLSTAGIILSTSSTGTIATGIDLSSLTISGDSLKLPNNVLIKGSGDLILGTTAAVSGGLLTMSKASAVVTQVFERRQSAGVIGDLYFRGRDSGAAAEDYAYIKAEIVDATAGSENGVLQFQTVEAGTLAARLTVGGAGGGVLVGSGTDPGAGSLAVQSNIGIATSAPDHPLDVRGEVSIFGSSASLARLRLRGFYTASPSDPPTNQCDIILVDNGVSPVFRVRYNDGGVMKVGDLALV